eukprot:5773370-Lingulodinium_polyedra.AAC.1
MLDLVWTQAPAAEERVGTLRVCPEERANPQKSDALIPQGLANMLNTGLVQATSQEAFIVMGRGGDAPADQGGRMFGVWHA